MSASYERGFTPIVLILIAAVFLAAIGGSYYLINLKKQYTTEVITGNQQTTPSPTSEPTANWKSFQSTDGSFFNFKYPANWQLSGASACAPIFSPLSSQNVKDMPYWLSICPADIDPTETPEKVEQTLRKGQPAIVKTISVDGHHAIIQEIETDQNNNYSDSISIFVANVSSEVTIDGGKPELKKGTKMILFTINDKSKKDEAKKILEEVLSTFKFTDSAAKPAETPSPNAKVLNYNVPSSWTTTQNSTGEYEISFNPKKYQSATAEKDGTIAVNYPSLIDPQNATGPLAYTISIKPYNGGSRHQFIDNILGTNYRQDTTYEKEYLVNGKSTLVIFNVDASTTTLLGMVPIDSKRAFLIGGASSDEPSIEELLQTLKVLK